MTRNKSGFDIDARIAQLFPNPLEVCLWMDHWWAPEGTPGVQVPPGRLRVYLAASDGLWCMMTRRLGELKTWCCVSWLFPLPPTKWDERSVKLWVELEALATKTWLCFIWNPAWRNVDAIGGFLGPCLEIDPELSLILQGVDLKNLRSDLLQERLEEVLDLD